jgi:hypothetical protein
MSMEASFIIQEDGTRAKKSGEMVYEGSPLTIDASTGKLKLAGATDKVYGLSKADSNTYRDFAWGEFGAFGSGQLTVLTRGIARVSHSVFNSVEVDSSTTPSSSPVTVKVYDDTKNYLAMQPLYVSAGGLITNDGAGGKNSLLGKCLAPLAAGAAGGLEIEVDANTTASAGEMAA